MKNIAIVLAGGKGVRMGADTPKQFALLGSRTVLEWAIDAFDGHESIDEVAVVTHPDWRTTTESLVAQNHWSKLTKVIDGGDERYLSSLNAIMAYINYDDSSNLLFHDAARPLVSAAVVSRVAEALRLHEAVGVGVPTTDTVWEVRPEMSMNAIASSNTDVVRCITHIPERRQIWLAQTPQAFRLPLIRDAYQRALQDPYFAATDDCGVVHRYMPEKKIYVVEGEQSNFKLTHQADLRRAELELKHRYPTPNSNPC